MWVNPSLALTRGADDGSGLSVGVGRCRHGLAVLLLGEYVVPDFACVGAVLGGGDAGVISIVLRLP